MKNSTVPLEPATMPGRVVVQWDKDDCADMGMIKVDLLGLGMMAVLEESINLISDAYGEQVDLAHLPPDDPAVYSALRRASVKAKTIQPLHMSAPASTSHDFH